MKHYTRKGHILTVAGIRVTDDPAGTELPNTPAVQEHRQLGRLLPVLVEKPKATRKKSEVAKK